MLVKLDIVSVGMGMRKPKPIFLCGMAIGVIACWIDKVGFSAPGAKLAFLAMIGLTIAASELAQRTGAGVRR